MMAPRKSQDAQVTNDSIEKSKQAPNLIAKNELQKKLRTRAKKKVVDLDSLADVKTENVSDDELLDKIKKEMKNPQAKAVRYNCDHCPRKFKLKSYFLKHLRLLHSTAPGSIPCKQCTARCPTQRSLATHMEQAHGTPKYQCQHCNKVFTRRNHISRHLKQKGCDGVQVEALTCEICNAKHKRKDNLIAHIRTHLVQKDYQCKHCTFSAVSYDRFLSHVRKKHMAGRYECDICGRHTKSRSTMTKHLEIHGNKKYECEVCGYATFTIEVMRRHVLRHTDDKPYKCDLCSQSFIQNIQLRRHLEKHLGHKCPSCDEVFPSKARMLVHKLEHYDGLTLGCPYKECPYFTKKFSSEAALQEHLQGHENRPYACEVCSKRFHCEVNLRRHVSTHTLERARRCMYCVSARAYVRGEMLMRHVRNRHPAIFKEHLQHVRQVLGRTTNEERVSKPESDAILHLLDAITDRIIENAGDKVLYGGMQDVETPEDKLAVEKVEKPLLSYNELLENVKKLMSQWVDAQTLKEFGWPDATVDVVLEKVIAQCGQTPADRSRFSDVQCLRENTKHLFLHVIEDKTIMRMLNTHTIDQVVMHILQVENNEA